MWALALAAGLMAFGQAPGAVALPQAVLDAPYQATLAPATGASRIWKIERGALPRDLALDAVTGVISGTPHQAGVFRFTTSATDPGTRDVRLQGYTLQVVAGVEVSWVAPPAVSGSTIAGTVLVTSHQPVMLTFICVAVNGIGKAFTLGYQHVELDNASLRIPFSATVPTGDYFVRVDAVGEQAATSAIYRAHLQTGATLNVP